jgi:chromate transport protein ChrA
VTNLSGSSANTTERPSLALIADVFTRYGNFTLGGGSATSAVIHGQIVARRHWVTDQQFGLCYALGRLTPGTNVLAFCTGIGWLLRGWSPNKKSALFALIGKAILFVSRARRVIQPILIASAGNWKPVKIRHKEMNFVAR